MSSAIEVKTTVESERTPERREGRSSNDSFWKDFADITDETDVDETLWAEFDEYILRFSQTAENLGANGDP